MRKAITTLDDIATQHAGDVDSRRWKDQLDRVARSDTVQPHLAGFVTARLLGQGRFPEEDLAREVARFGVRVNAVAPGFIDADMTASIDENARKKLYSQIPMGKPGTPKQVARAVLYLASEDAAYITGQVLTMDGGLS